MNIDLTTLFIPTVVIICLVVGFLIKHVVPVEAANRWIPVIVAVLGAVLACVTLGISLDSIAAGLVSGLGSVGMHQLVKQLMGDKREDDIIIYESEEPEALEDDPEDFAPPEEEK